MAKTPLNSTAPRLTIVVVVFNSATVIDDCLASITPGLPIIVVDNGSTDATVEHVRRIRPDAQIIENGLNLGYGIANNVGLAHVDTEFGMILNPDAIVIDSGLERLVRVLDRNPDAACAAPLLKSVDGKPEIYVMGPNEIYHTRLQIEPEGDICTWFLMGAAVIWRMSAWKEVGGFDENFFLYNEDSDLCLRTNRAGFSHILTPEAEVIHLSGQGAPRTLHQSWLRDWQMTWSGLYYKKKLGVNGIMASAAKLALWHGLKSLVYTFFFRPRKVLGEAAKFSASFQFLIGRGAHSANARAFRKSIAREHKYGSVVMRDCD